MPRIDDLFKDGLADHKISPGAGTWDRLSNSLSNKEAKVVLPWYYDPKKVALAALFISFFSFSVGYYFAMDTEFVQINGDIEPDLLAQVPVDYSTNTSEFKTRNEVSNQPTFNVEQEGNQEYSTDAEFSAKMGQGFRKQYQKSNTKDKALVRSGLEQSKNTGADKNNGIALNDLIGGKKARLNLSEAFSSLVIGNENLDEELKMMPFSFSHDHQGVIPTGEIVEELNYAKETRFFTQLDFFTQQGISKFASSSDETELVSTYLSAAFFERKSGFNLLLGRKMSENLSFFTGVSVVQNDLTVSGKRYASIKVDQKLVENREDDISVLSYERNFSSLGIMVPLGIRVSGQKNRLGYHVDLGTFAYKKLNEQSSIYLSDEDFAWISDDWADEVYQTTVQMGMFATAGVEVNVIDDLSLTGELGLQKSLSSGFKKERELTSHDGFSTLTKVGVIYKF